MIALVALAIVNAPDFIFRKVGIMFFAANDDLRSESDGATLDEINICSYNGGLLVFGKHRSIREQ